jgi:hypothetical protein
MIWFAPFHALGDEEPDPRTTRSRGELPHAPGDDDDEDGGEPDRARERPDPDEPRASRR